MQRGLNIDSSQPLQVLCYGNSGLRCSLRGPMFLDYFVSIKKNFHSRSCHRPTSKRRLSFLVSRYSNWASTIFALSWAKHFLTQKLPFYWNTHFRSFLEACLTQFQLLRNASLSNITGGFACPYPATCERARLVVKPKLLTVVVGFAVGPLAERLDLCNGRSRILLLAKRLKL